MVQLKPIIFLDIDGVLNTELDILADPLHRCKIFEHHLTALTWLAKEFDAAIVLSSTWRLWRTDEELADDLGDMIWARVIGKTPDLAGQTSIFSSGDEVIEADRHDEIVAWLSQNCGGMASWPPFIVLDDDDLTPRHGHDCLGENFIRTDFRFAGMANPRILIQAAKRLGELTAD